MRYAAKTKVPVAASRAEIEKILKRYGATHFAFAETPDKAMIAFQAGDRRVRLDLPLYGDDNERQRRQRWRALTLAIKAKLEVVESGIATFEQEFFAYVVLPDGLTVSESARESVALAYKTGRQMPLLPGPS